MVFMVDESLAASAKYLGSGPLSEIYFKDEANFPWIILIPRVERAISEIYQLNSEQQKDLMKEINEISHLINAHFNPHKLNIGALGNITRQLHIHVVGRFKYDCLWPQGIWQKDLPVQNYSATELISLADNLKQKLVHLIGKINCSNLNLSNND